MGQAVCMKLSLRAKILSGYALILLLLGFMVGLSLVSLQRLGRATGSVLTENYRSIIAAQNMIDAIERQDSAVLLVLLGYQEEGGRQYTDNIAAFMEWLGRAKDNITISGEGELVQALERSYLEYVRAYQSLLAEADASPESGRRYYDDTLLPLFLRVRGTCHELRDLNQTTMYHSSELARQVAQRATASVLAAGASLLVVGLVFSLLLSRIIVMPLKRVMDGIRAIERGDYDVKVSPASGDEMGRLASDFNSMARQLRRYRELNIGEVMAEKKKIETIMHNIDVGIVVLDAESRVTDMNLRASEILATTPAAGKGAHLLEVLGDERVFAQVKETLEQGNRFPTPGEDNNLTIDEGNKKRHYQYFVTPISLRPGKTQGAVLLLRDVTQLKEMNQLKSEFIMKASHELKNPLTGLLMSVSLLKEADLSGLTEKDRQLIHGAEEDLQRLKTIVDDLLNLSRIETGRLLMDIVETDLRVVIARAVEAMRGQAEEAGVSLEREHPDSVAAVRADANKIVLVLHNLIANALRHTPAGGTVRVLAQDTDAFVEVSVQDNGEGIPYEDQARIFDPFFQVKEPTGKSGSLGIGLALCREIVRAHQGTIWVDSVPGRGSTFSFTLPRAAPA
jgi:NtrC-family two-component system sensor histidine kinase KinB